jgi:hypothetical protein
VHGGHLTFAKGRLATSRLLKFGIVVHDDTDTETFGNLSINLFEEVQELGRPMTLVRLPDFGARTAWAKSVMCKAAIFESACRESGSRVYFAMSDAMSVILRIGRRPLGGLLNNLPI